MNYYACKLVIRAGDAAGPVTFHRAPQYKDNGPTSAAASRPARPSRRPRRRSCDCRGQRQSRDSRVAGDDRTCFTVAAKRLNIGETVPMDNNLQ